ncbi:MAG: hypothetical protein GY765_36350, partial [bacterium]|nr:hypothetical protein [bacterium]
MTEIKNTSLLNMITGAVGLAALFATLIYGGAGLSITLAVGGMVFFFEYLFNFRKERIFTPYLLMATAPLLLLKYSSLFDFRLRILCLILLIYIVSIACAGKARKLEFSLLQTNGFKIWLIAFLLFCLVSTVLYLRGIHLSGDEPHYLMIAQSLADDGDFDLKNNFTEKAYLSYIPVELRFHGGIYGGRYLSFHLPGLSFLLVPFYWLFKLLGGAVPAALYFRLVASFFNAFFVLMLFHIMRMSFPGRDITGLWLLVTAIFPLAFHSVHLYPELPAATCMMAAYYTAFSRRRNLLLAGLFLSFIPWLHVKYIPPLLVLALAIVYDNVKPLKPFRIDKEKLKRLMRFLLFPLINFILLTVFCMVLYNTLSPTNIFPKESYWTVPFLLRLKVFFAYFIDQRDGLLLYAPLYFLVFWSFKKRFQGKLLLLGIGFSYVFFHAFTSVRGAYSPAGRPLMFVSWIFVLFIAHYYFNILNPSVDETNHLPGDRENHLQADGQKHLPVDGENHHSADGQKYLPVDGANHPAASGASDKNWQRFFYRLLLGTSLAVPLWFLYYPLFMY